MLMDERRFCRLDIWAICAVYTEKHYNRSIIETASILPRKHGLLLNLLATPVTLGWGWHAAPTLQPKPWSTLDPVNDACRSCQSGPTYRITNCSLKHGQINDLLATPITLFQDLHAASTCRRCTYQQRVRSCLAGWLHAAYVLYAVLQHFLIVHLRVAPWSHMPLCNDEENGMHASVNIKEGSTMVCSCTYVRGQTPAWRPTLMTSRLPAGPHPLSARTSRSLRSS